MKTATIVSLLIARLTIGISVAAAEGSGYEPESTPDVSSSDGSCETTENLCSLWGWKDGWVLAGKNYEKNETIGFRDVVVPFYQHHRLAFPKWNRNMYFFPRQLGKPKEFVFAPGIQDVFECHKRFDNVRLVSEPAPENNDDWIIELRATRKLATGDPIFLPCHDEDLAAEDEFSSFPAFSTGVELRNDESSVCLGKAIIVKPSSEGSMGETGATNLGAFAGFDYKNGQTITVGKMLHMDRSELIDMTSGDQEKLLNYCYGHPSSSLLLLPLIPGVNAINHSQQKANVAVRSLLPPAKMTRLLTPPKGTSKLHESETARFYVEYTALKDIQEGEELFLDYGDEFEQAWQSYQTKYSASNKNELPPFRHEIGLPNDFFPKDWLERQMRATELPSFDTTPLGPGAIDYARVKGSGQPISQNIHRVGLPAGFCDTMQDFANTSGTLDVMREYILGSKKLESNEEERQRIDGGRWWVKRFWKEWSADMHYIAVDDAISTHHYMRALEKAGFDQVLDAIGKTFNLKSLTCYYATFIAVSHATYASMHADASIDGNFNFIFPIMQVPESDPELVLGEDNDGPLHVPYRYEREHGVLLGKGGLHGTAPCDYRGTNQMRVVASVYMADFSNKTVRDFVLEEWLDSDPPYPRIPDRPRFAQTVQHWHAEDPSKRVGAKVPMP